MLKIADKICRNHQLIHDNINCYVYLGAAGGHHKMHLNGNVCALF